MTTTNDTPDVILPELEVSDLVDKIPIELLDDSLLIDVDDLMNHQQQPQQQQPLISGRPPFRTDSFNKGTSNSLVLGTPFSILSSPGKQQQQQQQQFNINTSAQPFIPTIIPDVNAAVDRYRALCEMKKRGEFVQKAQKIKNVEFSFQPPPRQIMQRQRHAINNNNLVLMQQQQQFPFQQAALAQQQLLMQQQIIQQHMNYQHQTGGIYQQQQQQQFHQHQLQHQQFYHNGMNHQQYYQG